MVEHRIRDRKVACSSPGRGTGEISAPGSAFCADSYFCIRSIPCYRSTTSKIAVVLPNVQVAGYSKTEMHPTYVALHDVTM